MKSSTLAWRLVVWLSFGLPALVGRVALPFSPHSLVNDLVYGTVLVGGFALAQRPMPVLRPAVA